MSTEPKELFRGRVPTSTTIYIEVPVRPDGIIGAYIAWLDAVSSATITVELTSIPGVSFTSTVAWHWKDSGVSFTGPAASAAGAAMVNIENVRQFRARIKIVTAAVCEFFITDGGAP